MNTAELESVVIESMVEYARTHNRAAELAKELHPDKPIVMGVAEVRRIARIGRVHNIVEAAESLATHRAGELAEKVIETIGEMSRKPGTDDLIRYAHSNDILVIRNALAQLQGEGK